MELRARWLSLLVLFALLPAALSAQGSVKLSAAFEPASAKPGDSVTLKLTVEVSPGYHAYGTKEPTNVPVSIDPSTWQLVGLELDGAAKIPPGNKATAFGLDTYPLPEVFVVTQALKVKQDAAGEIAASATFGFQLCDENACEMPSSEPFTAKLTIAGSAPSTAGNAVSVPSAGAAQDPKPKPAAKQKRFRSKDGRITMTVACTPQPARPGESVTLTIEAEVEEGFHAYGTKEPTNLPVKLDAAKWQLQGIETDGAAVIPPGEEAEAFGIKTYPLPHEFRVTQKLRVKADQAAGTATIEGEFGYQVCDENGCEMPQVVPFAIDLPIEAGTARAAAPAAAPVDEDSEDGSLWALLLACIGGGLFALVMPCTYPMIPITFSFFTKQADARGGKVMSLALAYGFGIVAMFAAIGALASALGGYIVPFAAHWITNAVIGTAFVVFGLSLLGVITLQPPRFLTDAAGKSRTVGGLVGVLLMGATLVISSFTCTAPVVALLLVPAVQSGEGFRPMLGMATFGATMALPFVLLALLPGRVKKLPRSGEWMNTLKVSLGVVELAAALKFFSNAEYVQDLHVLPREVFFGIWIALFLALAVYLWGLVPRTKVGNGRRVGGLASAWFAAYCLYGALGYPLDFVMNALAPAYGARDISRHELVVDDYEKARALALTQGKLLLVNITGFTCANCRMVERGILPALAIAPILEQHFVEARLHMDNESVIEPTRWARQVKLRDELVQGRVTTPIYCSVDPKTGNLIVAHVLKGGPGAWEQGYLAFLTQSLAASGRSMATK